MNYNYNQYPGAYGRPPEKPRNEMPEILSLVFGILSILLCCLGSYGAVFGVLTGVGAIICFTVSPKKQAKKTGLAIAGLVTGIVGLVIAAAILCFALLFLRFGAMWSSYDRNNGYRNYYDYDDYYDDYDDYYDYYDEFLNLQLRGFDRCR